ncbi:MAG: IS66 family insertion sequence hypothetical protein [Paraburkholderia sp.]|nr:MAG: IS66 family insertion sequence hypothetical protein [Paraburkholderia sp.]TBR71601.1 MAG: IS66 family insertion sequence hypothetical protein [Burkholderiaceae bacterium]
MNMRSGTETALARMVSVFGAARPHHAYLFASRRGLLVFSAISDGTKS